MNLQNWLNAIKNAFGGAASSGRRRRKHKQAVNNCPAEVLEARQLLSATSDGAFESSRPVIIGPEGAVTDRSGQFAWEPVSGAERYELWVNNESSGASKFIHEVGLTTNSFAPNTDLPDGEYRFWVRASMGRTASKWSLPAVFHVGEVQAGSVARAVLTGPTGNVTTRPLIEWASVANASKYDVWINNLTTGESGVVKEMTAATQLTLTSNLTDGQYKVWVRASNDVSQGKWSKPLIFTVGKDVAIGQATITSPIASSESRPTISWTPAENAATYEIWMDNVTTGDKEFIHKKGIRGTSFTTRSDLADGEFAVWIRAENGAAKGKWSKPVRFNVGSPTTPEITGPLATTDGDNSTITWTAVSGAASYDVWVKDLNSANKGPVLHKKNVTSTSLKTTLLEGRYRVWVRVHEAKAWSAPGDFSLRKSGNQTPTPSDDQYFVDEDTVLDIAEANGVLANDKDAERDGLVASIAERPEHGDVILRPDGSFVYTPDTNFHGQDIFSYTVSDGSLRSDPVLVAVEIKSVNDAPEILGERDLQLNPGTQQIAIPIELLDLDGDALTVVARTIDASDSRFGVTVKSNEILLNIDQGYVGRFGTEITVTDGMATVSAIVTTDVDFHIADDGVLDIVGTDAADVVHVTKDAGGSRLHLILDSQGTASEFDRVFSPASVSEIRFIGAGGNDVFVNHTEIPVDAHGGAGNDLLIGGSENDRLDGGPGDDVLMGNQGINQLDDSEGDNLFQSAESGSPGLQLQSLGGKASKWWKEDVVEGTPGGFVTDLARDGVERLPAAFIEAAIFSGGNPYLFATYVFWSGVQVIGSNVDEHLFDKAFTDAWNQYVADPLADQLMTKNPSWYIDRSARPEDVELISVTNNPTFTPTYYVNGSARTHGEAFAESTHLSQQLNRPVRLIHNPSNGKLAFGMSLEDGVQALMDLEWGAGRPQHNNTTKRLAGLLEHHAERDEEVSIVGHSQGTIILRNAIRTILQYGHEDWVRTKLRVVLTGTPMSEAEFPNHYAAPSPADPDGPARLANPGDFFVEWLGEQSTQPGPLRDKVSFVSGGTEHSFIDSYVQNITNDMLWTGLNQRFNHRSAGSGWHYTGIFYGPWERETDAVNNQARLQQTYQGDGYTVAVEQQTGGSFGVIVVVAGAHRDLTTATNNFDRVSGSISMRTSSGEITLYTSSQSNLGASRSTALNTVRSEMTRMLGAVDFEKELNGKDGNSWVNLYVNNHLRDASMEALRTAIMQDHASLAIRRMMEEVFGGVVDYQANNARLGHRLNQFVRRAGEGETYPQIIAAIREAKLNPKSAGEGWHYTAIFYGPWAKERDAQGKRTLLQIEYPDKNVAVERQANGMYAVLVVIAGGHSRLSDAEAKFDQVYSSIVKTTSAGEITLYTSSQKNLGISNVAAVQTARSEMTRMLGPINFHGTLNGEIASYWVHRYSFMYKSDASLPKVRTAIMKDHRGIAVRRMMEQELGGPVDQQADATRLGHRLNQFIERARNGESHTQITNAIRDAKFNRRSAGSGWHYTVIFYGTWSSRQTAVNNMTNLRSLYPSDPVKVERQNDGNYAVLVVIAGGHSSLATAESSFNSVFRRITKKTATGEVSLYTSSRNDLGA